MATTTAPGGTPGAGMGSSPPGGMGVTSQGFGQEGYILDQDDQQQLPKPPPEAENFAVGVPYYLPFATPYRDSWEIFRDNAVSIKQLQAMIRMDGQARSLYRLLTMPALAALKNADVIPVSGETGGTAEAQFCKDLLLAPKSAGGMVYPFKRFVRQMLMSLFTGFSAWEQIYWVPQTGPNKGKITLRELGWRPSDSLTFLLDGQGQHNGFRQRTFFQGRTIDVKIPRDTALYFANEEAERPFYGVSMFEAAFYHYDKKVKLYYITHLAAQRKAVGMRIGSMAPNPPTQDKNNFIKGISELGLASWMVVPNADWTVTTLQDATQFDFLGLINHHNSQMSKSVLAPWWDDAQGGGQGETSMVDFGNQSDATFLMLQESFLEDMATMVSTEIFPRFVDWNFGSGKYPQFKWGELTAEQKAAIQETFTQLAAAGQQANVTPDFMLGLEEHFATDLGLDIDYDKIKADRAKQQDLMEQQYGEGQVTVGPDGTPSPLGGFPQQQPGFGQDQQGNGPGGPPGAGGGPGGSPGQGGPPSGIPPNLLPQGFQQVQASMSPELAPEYERTRKSVGQLLDEMVALSRSE